MLNNYQNIDFNSDQYLRMRLERLERVIQSLRSNQQRLLKILYDEDDQGLYLFLRDNDAKLNDPLSKSIPITALNFAASMVL